jgi:hypothetical protein
LVCGTGNLLTYLSEYRQSCDHRTSNLRLPRTLSDSTSTRLKGGVCDCVKSAASAALLKAL